MFLILLRHTFTGSHWDPRRSCGGVSGTHICVGPGGTGKLQNPAKRQGGWGGEGESWARAPAAEIPSRENTQERMSRGGDWCHVGFKHCFVFLKSCESRWLSVTRVSKVFFLEVSGAGWPNWTREESHEGEGKGKRTEGEGAREESKTASWPVWVFEH